MNLELLIMDDGPDLLSGKMSKIIG